jgi:hypothetical protein
MVEDKLLIISAKHFRYHYTVYYCTILYSIYTIHILTVSWPKVSDWTSAGLRRLVRTPGPTADPGLLLIFGFGWLSSLTHESNTLALLEKWRHLAM